MNHSIDLHTPYHKRYSVILGGISNSFKSQYLPSTSEQGYSADGQLNHSIGERTFCKTNEGFGQAGGIFGGVPRPVEEDLIYAPVGPHGGAMGTMNHPQISNFGTVIPRKLLTNCNPQTSLLHHQFFLQKNQRTFIPMRPLFFRTLRAPIKMANSPWFNSTKW